MKKIFFVLAFVVLVSCKTVFINNQNYCIATTPVEIGAIGVSKKNLYGSHFHFNAIPELNQKIRVSALRLPFTKAIYKAYLKSTRLKGEKEIVKYVDSLAVKPFFISLKIIDEVAVLQELKANKNANIYSFLKSSTNSKLINTIFMVLEPITQNEIQQAEELYLVNNKHKKYSLELYKDKKLFRIVDFSKGAVFAYKNSTFCWKEDSRHKVVLDYLIDENESCKDKSYNSYRKAVANKKVYQF